MIVIAAYGDSKIVGYDASAPFAEQFTVSLCGETPQPIRVAKVAEDKIGVSVYGPPYHIFIRDIETGAKDLGRMSGTFTSNVWGLDCLVTHDEKTLIIVGDCEGNLVVFDLETAKMVGKCPDASGSTYVVRAVKEWDSQVISGGDGGKLRRYDAVTCKALGVASGHSGAIEGLSVDVMGSRAFSGCTSSELRMWGSDTWNCTGVCKTKGSIYSVLYADSVGLVFAGLGRGEVGVCDPRKFSVPVKVISPLSHLIYDMCQVEDDLFVAIGRDVAWLTSSGKKKVERKIGSTLEGVCSVGTAYDRLVTEGREVDDGSFRERCELVGQLVFPERGILSCQPSRIVLSLHAFVSTMV